MDHAVICVDDDQNTLSSLKRLLWKEPYTFVTTTDPQDVLSCMKEFDISIAIIDQRMPKMTGVELATKIKECSQNTFVILLTGYQSDVPIALNVMSGKVDILLFKPWDDKELKKTIFDLLCWRECMDG